MFTVEEAQAWLERAAVVIGESATELTRLDAAIGDGDHGTNMARGMDAAMERVRGGADTLEGLLKGVGMALIGKVGGAAGPLYGSWYLAIGKRLGDGREVADAELSAAFRDGYEGVVARGKAQPGDKTMLDALGPAASALEDGVREGLELGEALNRAALAAEEGMKATVPLVARKGRASYLGERSRGHQDPGATSSWLLTKALADVVNDS